MLKKRAFTLLLVGWLIVVFTMSLMPPNNIAEAPKIPHLDKVAHFIFYFVLTILIFLTLRKENNCIKKIKNIYIFSFVFAFLIGIFIELLQKTLTNYRSGDFYDALFNTFGIVVALLFVENINKKLLN